MEQYGKILLFAMPAFLILVLFEKWVGWRKGNDTVRNMDMISSLSSGVTNVTKDVLGLAVALISYEWLVSKVAFIHIDTNWVTYIIVFIVLDFAGYTVHALDHKINFFWNSHIYICMFENLLTSGSMNKFKIIIILFGGLTV